METEQVKVFGYIRVSTDTQMKKGYGLDSQNTSINEFCLSKGYEVIKTFRDEGISGTEISKRLGLMDLISNLTAVRNVVVVNTSRLWRDDYSCVMIKRELKKLQANVFSIEQPNYSIHETDPSNFLVNSIMEAFDQYERMTINLKLLRGRRTKVGHGTKGCGNTPIGYRWDYSAPKSVIVEDETTSGFVRMIFDKYIEIRSLPKLRDHLFETGYLTEKGRPICTASLYWILTNPFYIGRLNWGGIKTEGKHPALIDSCTYQMAQGFLKRGKLDNKTSPNSYPKSANT